MENFEEAIEQYTVKEIDPKTGFVSYRFKYTSARMRYIDIREPRKMIKKPRLDPPVVRERKPKMAKAPPQKRYKKFVKLKIEDKCFKTVEAAAIHYGVSNNTIYQWIYRGINGAERIYE